MHKLYARSKLQRDLNTALYGTLWSCSSATWPRRVCIVVSQGKILLIPVTFSLTPLAKLHITASKQEICTRVFGYQTLQSQKSLRRFHVVTSIASAALFPLEVIPRAV